MAAVAGVQETHVASRSRDSTSGSCQCSRDDLKILKLGAFALATSLSALKQLPNAQPMFDWPAHNQTSPIAMSFSAIVLFPRMVSEWPVPCDGVSSDTCHRPAGLAVALAVFPQLALTVTFSPGSAKPHTVLSIFCCSTIWSLKRLGMRTSAFAMSWTLKSKVSVVSDLMKNIRW